ncbi:MAG: serine/threonine-protein phosphatase [Clostridia bacterium]|nr:serine/threonine-protein phosphatase [Clostridia bacterium]
MRYKINYACVSNIGKVRSMNQDNLICDGLYMDSETAQKPFFKNGSVSPKDFPLFGIFDGMGGEELGEVASLIAAQESAKIKGECESVTALSEYCERTNAAICTYAEENGVSAMGTTAAMLLFSKDEITLCNIGDSKIFRLASGRIDQISMDHVAIAVYGRKPPLTQHLGVPPEILLIDPYFSRGGYAEGDKYLICSDGLTDMVGNEEINEIVNGKPVEEAVELLVQKALENGGKDNITIILLEIKQNDNRLFAMFKNK